jgi:hypothetical protein
MNLAKLLNSAATSVLVFLLAGSLFEVKAGTIVSVGGSQASIGGYSVQAGFQHIATSWSSTGAYSGVTITADLIGFGIADVTAYLMTQIGPGTTTSAQVALNTVRVSTPQTYTLFSDLSLGPGSYDLVLSTATPSESAGWSFVVANQLVTIDAATAFGGWFDACSSSTCDPYVPASVFRGPTFTFAPVFSVSGTSTAIPEPSTVGTCAFGLLVAIFCSRRRGVQP